MLPVVKDYKYVGSAKLWSQAESANPRQDLYQPDQFLPFLCLADPDERGAVLSVWPELVARLDHVVAEILVVGHHLPLQAQLFGRDVVVEQDLRPDGWRGESDEILIARAAWPSLAWPRPSKKNF